MTARGTFREWHCDVCNKHFYKTGIRKESAIAIAKVNHERSKSHMKKVEARSK